MLQIPLQSVPSQRLSVVLSDQNCQLFLYQKEPGIFVDLNVDGLDVSIAVIARDAVQLNFGAFIGDLYIIDTQGSLDPYYSGLGSRFQLIYLTEADYGIF